MLSKIVVHSNKIGNTDFLVTDKYKYIWCDQGTLKIESSLVCNRNGPQSNSTEFVSNISRGVHI